MSRSSGSCDNLLEAWADIEDRIVRLVHAYPELAEEGEELEGEFELDEMVVRRFRQGQGFYRLNMFVEAEEAFREVVEEEPEFLLGRVYLALSHFQKGNTDEAYRHFQLIASTTNHDVFIAFAHHMMGCVRVREGDERGAIRQFRKALSHRQNEADTWFNLGACHYRLGEYHEAIPCFYQALLLDENDGEAMWMLANCHRKLKQWDSVAYWRMLAFEKTDSLQAMETIARDYEEMGETEKALSWYRKILSRDARRIGAYQGMGWNTWVAGRGQEALAWLKKGLSLAPGDPDLLFTYAWILLEMGRCRKSGGDHPPHSRGMDGPAPVAGDPLPGVHPPDQLRRGAAGGGAGDRTGKTPDSGAGALSAGPGVAGEGGCGAGGGTFPKSPRTGRRLERTPFLRRGMSHAGRASRRDPQLLAGIGQRVMPPCFFRGESPSGRPS